MFRLFRSLLLPALFLATAMSLSACKNAQEKAEDYYQSGIALLAKGDDDRALIEFRNVFKYDGTHKAARQAYADILLKRGDLAGAYSQYLRLIEQYPDTVEVRQTLAEIALDMGNWDEVERHGRAAIKLAPDQPRSQALSLLLDYRQAVLDRDPPRKDEIAEKSLKLLESQPDSLMLRRIVIDDEMGGPTPLKAMPHVEAGLKLAPKNFQLNSMKLQLLRRANDMAGVGAQLKTMVALFPQEAALKQTLIRWYLDQKDNDGAEAFLRAEAGEPTAAPEGHLSVVQFLNAIRGTEAGRAELTRLIAANKDTPNADIYGSVLATMDFDAGHKAEAIAALEAILEKATPSDQTRKIMTTLAHMQDATGARDKARALVTKVIAEDATNVEALQLRATWAIGEDRTGDAIIDLRAAQSQAPRDPRIMTLLAVAFQRDGSMDLAGEQLAKAVEASGSAPDEALRYAGFLRQQGRIGVAETVLTDARRASPDNPLVLTALAEVLLQSRKWASAQEIADKLRKIDQPRAQQAAQQIQAAILLGQNRIEEGLSLLENQAQASTDDIRPTLVVVTAQIQAGKAAEARAFLDTALAKTPDNLTLRLLSANVDAILGQSAKAEAAYRALIAEEPKAEAPVRLLYGLLRGAGRAEEATQVLVAGLKEMPDTPNLLWARAGEMEAAGDFDGAITIYEKLYAQDSSSVIQANNLASMIATYRNDAESLDRAATIARRLRGMDVPAFQDTYGWIAYRRGNLDDALSYLEPAAKGLADDPVTQFHLGMVYADLGRKDEAIAQLRHSLEMGEGRDLPPLEEARKRLAELTAAP